MEAAITGFLRGATLGLSNLIWYWSSGEQATIDIEGLSRQNPNIWTGSTAVGTLSLGALLFYLWRRRRGPRDARGTSETPGANSEAGR